MKDRRIIILAFISLDGVMQAPGAPEEDRSGGFKYGGWTVPYFDDELGEVMGEQMSRTSELLLGRKTFEIFYSYWPEHDNEWPGINSMKKYEVSNTISNHEWENTLFLRNADEIRALKKQNGPDLQVHGSVSLIQTLLRNGLADELWLKTFPVILGGGKRLFGAGTNPGALRLKESKCTSKGVVIATYEKAGDVKTGSFGT